MATVFIVYKNGTYKRVDQGAAWEYQEDPDYLLTIPCPEPTPALPEDVNASAKEYADGFYPIKDYSCYESDYDYRTQVAKNEQVQEHYKAGAAHIQKQGEATVKKAQADLIWAMIQENQDADDGPFTKSDIEADLYDWFKKLEIKNPVSIPSSIVRRLEEMRDKIFELAEKETDDFQRRIYFSHGSDINIASQLITKYASILLSPQPEIKLEEDINVAMAEGAEFVVTRMVGDDPQPAEQGEPETDIQRDGYKWWNSLTIDEQGSIVKKYGTSSPSHYIIGLLWKAEGKKEDKS